MPVSDKPRKVNKSNKVKTKTQRRTSLKDGLMAIDIECVSSLGLARNIIVHAAQAVRDNPKLNTDEVVEVSKILAKDIMTFKSMLDQIRINTPLELRRSNVEHKLLAIELSQEYEMWLDKFRNVVMTNVGKLDSLVRDVKHNDQIDRLQEDFDAEVETND